MALLYLAHDVILRDKTGQYGSSFGKVLLPAITALVESDKACAPKISRVADVWLQRSAFSSHFVASVRKVLQSTGARRNTKPEHKGKQSLLASTAVGPSLGTLDDLSLPFVPEDGKSGGGLATAMPPSAWRDAPPPPPSADAAVQPLQDLHTNALLRARLGARLATASKNSMPEWSWGGEACPLPRRAAAPVAAKSEALARTAHVLAVHNTACRGQLLAALSDALDGVMGTLDSLAAQREQVAAALQTAQEHQTARAGDTWVDALGASSAPSGSGAAAASAADAAAQVASRLAASDAAEAAAGQRHSVLIMLGGEGGGATDADITRARTADGAAGHTADVASSAPPGESAASKAPTGAPSQQAAASDTGSAADSGAAGGEDEADWMHALGIDGQGEEEGGEGGVSPAAKRARGDDASAAATAAAEEEAAGRHFTIKGRTVVYNPKPKGMVFNPITRQMQSADSMILDESWRD